MVNMDKISFCVLNMIGIGLGLIAVYHYDKNFIKELFFIDKLFKKK